MPPLVLPAALAELREAARYYRNVPPPAVGKQLARRLMDSFTHCVRAIEEFGTTRPEHPDIPGARFVAFAVFPYLAFYTVRDDGQIVVVSIEYATSDYVDRVTARMTRLRP